MIVIIIVFLSKGLKLVSRLLSLPAELRLTEKLNHEIFKAI